MKFSVAHEQKDFFDLQGAIEFEGLVNEGDLSRFRDSISEGLSHQLNVTGKKIDLLKAEELYSAGRDVWRHSGELHKIISHRRFGEIASQLIDNQILRLGYDQYFPNIYRSSSHS